LQVAPGAFKREVRDWGNGYLAIFRLSGPPKGLNKGLNAQ
jgi:hypothetical protein